MLPAFIRSAIVKKLSNADPKMLGRARSDAGAKSSRAAGVHMHRGDLQDLESLRGGAAVSDGSVYTAFIHYFEA
jgi:hypothetical protein